MLAQNVNKRPRPSQVHANESNLNSNQQYQSTLCGIVSCTYPSIIISIIIMTFSSCNALGSPWIERMKQTADAT